jgi:hypothetical protein
LSLLTVLNSSDKDWWTTIFRDQFGAGDVAAGSVNGTYSDDGNAKRVVTDAESKLSIASGVLAFAGGKAAPAWGDPGIWYTDTGDAAFSVGAGHALLFTVVAGTTAKYFNGGLDANTSANFGTTYVNFDASGLIIRTGDGNVNLGAYSAQEYTFLVVQRNGTHGYLYFQHVSGVQWKLVAAVTDAEIGSGSVYPSLQNYDLTATVSEVALYDLSSRVTADFSEQSGLDATPAEGETITRAAGSALIDFGAITLPGTDSMHLDIRYVDATNYTRLYVNADGSGSIKETVGGVEGGALGSCAASTITAADLQVIDDAGSVRVVSALTDAFSATLTDHSEATSVKITSLGT